MSLSIVSGAIAIIRRAARENNLVDNLTSAIANWIAPIVWKILYENAGGKKIALKLLQQDPHSNEYDIMACEMMVAEKDRRKAIVESYMRVCRGNMITSIDLKKRSLQHGVVTVTRLGRPPLVAPCPATRRPGRPRVAPCPTGLHSVTPRPTKRALSPPPAPLELVQRPAKRTPNATRARRTVTFAPFATIVTLSPVPSPVAMPATEQLQPPTSDPVVPYLSLGEPAIPLPLPIEYPRQEDFLELECSTDPVKEYPVEPFDCEWPVSPNIFGDTDFM